tara:strand:- start:72 stop:1322 length:1251 start_codon:yes stop_codon:yes gene_type:complete
MKLNKKDFKNFSKEEQELISMVATMSTGNSIEPKNLHLMTKQSMKATLDMMKKEQKSMSSDGKKMVQSILNKARSLTEQYGAPEEDEEQRRYKELAMKAMQQMKMAKDNMEKTAPGLKGMMKPGSVRPLETGQPGAISADLGFEDLAGMVRKPSLPPPPSTGQAPSPDMGGQRPPMPKMPPMMGQKPPMGGQMPPMMGQKPPMPPIPSMDDQPGLPPKPRQAPGGPPMGGMGAPPAETEGPRAMEPAPEFGKRMGIKDVERHHLRPEEDDVLMAPPGAAPAGPGMPPAGGMPPQEGPQQGQPVPPQLAQDPAAPKEMPRQLPPGTTEASQEFIDKYAQQIKSFLRGIIRDEEDKFARGRDLTAMPKNFKEQVANAVGGGMSPVMGGEGGIKGRDKMLGRTGGMRRRRIENNYRRFS